MGNPYPFYRLSRRQRDALGSRIRAGENLRNAALIARLNISEVPGHFDACIERQVRDQRVVRSSTGETLPYNPFHAWAFHCRNACDQILPLPNSPLYFAVRDAVLSDTGPGADYVIWGLYDYTGASQRLVDAATVWHDINQSSPLIWQGWQELARQGMEINQAMSVSFAAQCGGARAYMGVSPLPWLLLAAGGALAWRHWQTRRPGDVEIATGL